MTRSLLSVPALSRPLRGPPSGVETAEGRSGGGRQLRCGLVDIGFRLLLALVVVFYTVVPAQAVRPDEMLADPALEARARAIGQELRCLVCRNQSIDDSEADLAHDLRVLVRERLKAGDSDRQVVDYIRARYGDFVLLKPPFEAATWLLWGGPALLLALGLAGLARYLRRQKRVAEPPPLSVDEERRLARLLEQEGGR
ncbi:MAG TPA: cytochrome c-type biogenesis protein [Stellaceae bacterium]|nr:cytochrome c-type biogenesis protein [Stellaceae bacterium]